MELALVGELLFGRSFGKLLPAAFLPVFERVMALHGWRVSCYRTAGDVAERPDAAVLVYCEDKTEQLAEARILEDGLRRRFKRVPIVHGADIGAMLGHKAASNAWFMDRGVLFPRIFERDPGHLVFVNDPIGSGGGAVGRWRARRYCTEVIDTRVKWRGHQYYWMIRAMMVGERVTYLDARARTTGGDACVHYLDVTPDADAINYFSYAMLPRWHDQAMDLVERIGRLLGLGFWSADLMPGRDGKLYVAEVGMKWQLTKKPRLERIAQDIAPYHTGPDDSILRSAWAFAEGLERL